MLYVCADHVALSKLKPATRVASGCCCRQAFSSYVLFAPTQPRPYVFCRDWEVLDSQISLSPSRLSKISVVQNLLVATVALQVPTSCDGNKSLTVGLGG